MFKQPFKIPALVRNKYVVTTAAFILWLAFLDRNNMLSQYELTAEVNKMEAQKEFYRENNDATRKESQELLSSMEKLEKFAREQYKMKKDNEDVFLIMPEKPKED
ncbi:septum formation initiator family protein [Chitinophaga horti]|uniref:Septum formation initiator family protein n=1 Tax=Chitinophaga horti TaxID=2920382 RepID=A0ABY6IY36_9BACT|nr:septum formation initiator family protein [Chitinophaga horti]UYQ92301.1 septum formation initiator family protein [Chitinophaga horti]